MTHVNFNGKPFASTLNTLVDDLFTELPVLFKNEFNKTEGKGFVPANVKETATGYQLEIVAPGFEKSDFDVKLDQQILTVSGEKKTEQKESTDVKERKTIRNEYSFRSFKRSFTIDEKIDATKIEASYINGVLTLNLPKKETVKPEVTEIKIN